MAAVPSKVPWDDLRYLFGEIMYGGHITDDWDRRLCRTYLAEYIRVEMLEGEILLAPGFQIPPNLDYKVRGAPSRDGETRETRAPSGSQSDKGVLAHGLPGEGLRHRPYGQTLQEEASGQKPERGFKRQSSMEQEGKHPVCGGGRPQQGVGPEGKGWTEGSRKRGFMQGRRRLQLAQLSLLTQPPFTGLPRIHRREPAPREPLPVRPAPQRGDRLPDGHLGEAVPHCPGDAAQGDRLGGWHRGLP